MALPTLSLLCLLPLAYGVTVGTSGTSAGLLVCKNKPCKKSGALDTFDSLFALATASEQANAKSSPSVAQASLQASFAAARIASSGCLAHCGSGPNCAVDNAPEDVLHDVYKPASCVALLSHVGIDVPEAAQKAWLRRMYAMRAMRSNKPAEAVSLLTEAYAPKPRTNQHSTARESPCPCPTPSLPHARVFGTLALLLQAQRGGRAEAERRLHARTPPRPASRCARRAA